MNSHRVKPAEKAVPEYSQSLNVGHLGNIPDLDCFIMRHTEELMGTFPEYQALKTQNK